MKIKNYLAYFTILFLTFSFSEKAFEYYDDGIISASGSLIDGKKEGKWIFYSCDGATVQFEGNYKNDVKHGEFIYYGYFGKTNIYHKKKSETFKDGILNGKYIYYFENGKINSIAEYKDGIQVGEYIFYDENGVIYWEGSYENGELIDGDFIDSPPDQPFKLH